MRYTIRIAAALVVLAMALGGSSAWATVTQVNPSPTTTNIALGPPVSVTVIWRVTRANDGQGNCGPTVSSASGVLHGNSGNGPPITTVPTLLTQTRACPPGPNAQAQFTFTETLLVPADVVQRA